MVLQERVKFAGSVVLAPIMVLRKDSLLLQEWSALKFSFQKMCLYCLRENSHTLLHVHILIKLFISIYDSIIRMKPRSHRSWGSGIQN